MNILLNIIIDEESPERDFSDKYTIERGTISKIEIKLISSLEEDYIEEINKIDELRKNISKGYKYIDKMPDVLKDKMAKNKNIKFIKKFLNKDSKFYKALITNIDYIKIEAANYKDILEYLTKNPVLKNEKILLPNYFNLDSNIDEIESIFKDYDNIYIMLDGNKVPIKLSEFRQTQNIIDNIVNDIKKYNFSPIEQIMYAYDIVRNRVYTKESDDEKYSESRDLTRVLLGDKIVCAGYTNILKAILDKLNIKNIYYSLSVKNNDKLGHALNLVYVKDDKYNIDGVYYFDATWDSKRKNNNYLYGYRFFANTHKQMLNDHKTLKDVTLPNYSDNLVRIFIEELNKNGIKKVDERLISTINQMAFIIDGKSLITPFDLASDDLCIPENLKKEFNAKEVIKKLKRYDKLFSTELNADTLLRILYNVRKIEYYNDPINYPFDIDTLYSVVVNSKWKFVSYKDIELLKAIFGDEIEKYIQNDTLRFFKENNIELDISRVKLTRTLKNIYEMKNKQ